MSQRPDGLFLDGFHSDVRDFSSERIDQAAPAGMKTIAQKNHKQTVIRINPK